MTYKKLLFKSLSQVNNQQSPPCCWTCWKAEFSSLACSLSLPLSICLSLFSPVPPRCWFNGKEVSLFILDNYLSGNPLKQFAVALFCGERNDLSEWYLTSQRDKKTTRELAVRPTPPLYRFFSRTSLSLGASDRSVGSERKVTGGIWNMPYSSEVIYS